MKTLTLIRHAKSSWSNPGLRDFDRPLNNRGERDAPRMGARLAASGLVPDLMVSSPAVRARTTSRVLAEALGYPPDSILEEPAVYEAGLRDLVDVVHGLDPDKSAVCLVGHNPGFTELARYLCGEPLDHLPTCAVVHLQWEDGTWTDITRGSGDVVFFDYPKNKEPAPRVSG